MHLMRRHIGQIYKDGLAYVTQTSLLTEPKLDKTNKITCASSEDSDQHGHVPSLVSLHCPFKWYGFFATHKAHSKD